MKKILLALILPAVFPFATIDWETVNITDDMQASMPVNSEKKEFAATAWRYQYAFEDSARMGAVVNKVMSNFTQQAPDKILEGLKSMRETNKSRYVARGEKIISMTESTYKNVPTVELVASFTKYGTECFHYSRILLYNTATVEMFYYSGSNGNDEKMKERFFNSLEFK